MIQYDFRHISGLPRWLLWWGTCLPIQETKEMVVQFPGWEGPLEEGKSIHPSILAWRIPWTEKPGGLQSMGSQRVRHKWLSTHACSHMSGSWWTLASQMFFESLLNHVCSCPIDHWHQMVWTTQIQGVEKWMAVSSEEELLSWCMGEEDRRTVFCVPSVLASSV